MNPKDALGKLRSQKQCNQCFKWFDRGELSWNKGGAWGTPAYWCRDCEKKYGPKYTTVSGKHHNIYRFKVNLK